MKEFLDKHGFWFYKDCGCTIPGKVYKNKAGLEVKVTQRTGEWQLSRNGKRIDQGIIENPSKMVKWL